MKEQEKKEQFIKIFKAAEKHYSKSRKRLAAEEWKHDWQTLIATIMSAQSRDETTIPIAEKLFKKHPTLESIARATPAQIKKVINSINYNNTKAKNIVLAANHLLKHHNGKIPSTIEELLAIPGVGRKTANLILSEVHGKQAICTDTHVHRLSNVLGFVKTKTPEETERELMKIVPRKYWNKINRVFVLWGKEVPGKDKEKLLEQINHR